MERRRSEHDEKLSDIGLALSITGGIIPEDIHLFKEINAKAFIAGRAFTGEAGKLTAEKCGQKLINIGDNTEIRSK